MTHGFSIVSRAPREISVSKIKVWSDSLDLHFNDREELLG